MADEINMSPPHYYGGTTPPHSPERVTLTHTPPSRTTLLPSEFPFNELTISDVPTYRLPEMNFNHQTYFTILPNYQIDIPPPQVLRQVQVTPNDLAEEWEDLLMLNGDNIPIPAHLPLVSDLVHFRDDITLYLRWTYIRHHREYSTLIVPPELATLVDPRVRLPQNVEVLNMRSSSISLTVESFSDAVRIIRNETRCKQIRVDVSWGDTWGESFHNRPRRLTEVRVIPRKFSLYDTQHNEDVDFTCKAAKKLHSVLWNSPTIPYGLSILYWNARGIGRPSFLRNFTTLVEAESPDIVILSETRLSRNNALTIIPSLPYNMFHIIDPVGLSGGIIILWRSTSPINFHTVTNIPRFINGVIHVN